MSSLAKILDSACEGGPDGIGRFASSLDREWISTALALTKSATVRRRKLPAEQVVWLVVGMALFADRSIRDVVDHLDLVLPGVDSLAPSAIPAARYRVGAEPIKWLFSKVAEEYSTSPGLADFHGLSMFAVDGSCMKVQDSDDNFEHFGKPGGRAGANDAGYPQLRIATLMDLRTRLLSGASFGPYSTSENTLAKDLWPLIPDDSLLLLDRGYMDYLVFSSYISSGKNKHLLVRMKSNVSYTAQTVLADGTLLATIKPTRAVKRANPDVEDTLTIRIIEYQHEGGDPCRVFTTLLDPKTHPAKELIELYHDRWEIEIGYDEVKTHMLERKECLRSKKPEGVEQELWGILLTYNLVRREMLLAAQAHDLQPARISFRSSLLWVRNFWLTAWRTSPGNVPKHLGELRSTLNVLILPQRRSDRRYPRHVKIKMSKYKRNRGKRTQSSTTTAECAA